MSWRKVFEEFSKTDGETSHPTECLFCLESKYDYSICPANCPLVCVGFEAIGGRCVPVFGFMGAMTNERRLAICNYVLDNVKRFTVKNIRAAIASQLTDDERKIYEGE